MAFTSPQVAGPILILLLGIFLLLLIALPFGDTNSPIAGIGIGGTIIVGSIIWMCRLKADYHVDLSTASGEIHVLTSKNKAYIERVVLSVNEAIVKYQ